MKPTQLSIVRPLLGAVVGLTMSLPALAWGPQGHALVADIAAAHLEPQAQAAVTRLLANEGHNHLDEIASWPDAIRSERTETGPWHYVDIPLDKSHYQDRRDCPDRDCVVARISYFADILGNASASQNERVEALKFLVHFVGDVQQPLHAEDDDDKGGNEVELSYFGHPTNLHAIWDSGIVDRALDLHVAPDYSIDYAPTRRAARQLDRQIGQLERRAWSRDIARDQLQAAAIRWAEQAHELAQDVAYADLPPAPRQQWSSAYQRQAWPVARRQIQRGGIRLAAVLNAVLTQ
ncbi:S1/P1 nuclease [Salinisphaera sp. SPP-AMP-43]|uniref:S1/P1 nuclease n=1 Tax=Salinisphaera sp. SPP-AMP-43 TaxID=3121288 RepID=UPI003C6E2B91